jgi:hypothetical protein
MSAVGRAVRGTGHAVRRLVQLVREGESDLEGTYPDEAKPTGEDAARQAAVNLNLSGLGNSGMGM